MSPYTAGTPRATPPSEESDPIRFLTPRQLREQSPPSPPWVWEGLVARGALTIFGGKPKVGKSTLTYALVDAVASDADSFLGRSVTGGGVVVITEEGAITALDKLPDRDNILVLVREQAWPKPTWTDLIERAASEAELIGASMILIDSFAYWARLPAEAEKDPGAVQVVLDPLLEVVKNGYAVLLIHHQRKGGGEGGDALRGSGGIAGNADAIMELERVSGDDAPPHHRQLLSVARWEAPPLLVVDRDPVERSWRVVGEGDGRGDAANVSWRERIHNALPNEDGATFIDLGELLPGQKRDWLPALNGLVDGGQVVTAGRGVKGDPKRYWRAAAECRSDIPFQPGTETNGNGLEAEFGFRSFRYIGTESNTASNGIPSDSIPNGNEPDPDAQQMFDEELR